MTGAERQRSPQRIGVLGGTFDPVHMGHLRLAEEATEELALDRCLFIPAWAPPHKAATGIVAFEHRYRMLELALADNPRFVLSDLERRRTGPSYTVTTLRHLLGEFREPVELHFLLGLDAFLEIHGWWHYREIFQLATLVVCRRPDHARAAVQELLRLRLAPGYCWDEASGRFVHPQLRPVILLPSTFLEISSSAVRRLLRAGKSVRYLVPEAVLRYIVKKGLY